MRIFLYAPSPVQQWRGFGDFTAPRGLAVSSALPMNLFVTRHAKRHQIAFIVRATVRNRLDVMHKRREDVSAPLFAHLTE